MTSSLPWKNAFDFLTHPNEFVTDADIVVAGNECILHDIVPFQ